MRHQAFALLLLTSALNSASQDSLTHYGSYLRAEAEQLWTTTGNAASLTRDTMLANRGYTAFGYKTTDGDFHRVQEGRLSSDFGFTSERYQAVGRHLYGYGRFSYGMAKTNDRAWCDQMRPYDSNPYLSGSNVEGRYEQQSFELSAALATQPLGHFTYGLGVDYGVTDLSRLRDPRSRSKLLSYRLSPSATFRQGAHTLGLAAHYRRRKEKMGSIITVQEDASQLWYYYLSGMENASGKAGNYTAYQREWVEHSFGAELSYALRRRSMHSLWSVALDHGSEQVLEQYKRQPGCYAATTLTVATRNRLERGGKLHQLDLSLSATTGHADEYKQELQTTTDAETGFISYSYATLITYPKRYEVSRTTADLRYRLHWLDGQHAERAYAGLNASYDRSENRHNVPDSHLYHSRLTTEAEGGWQPAKAWWVEATAAYSRSTEADLLLANATTDYALGVLLPDMRYYGAHYWQARLAVTYQLPLTVKGHRSTWYVRADGTWLKATGDLSTHTLGLTLGLFN